MNSARIATSPRLQRVHALLADGEPRSTMEIVARARVCAVNSIVAELRDQGARIECRQVTGRGGERIWMYRMLAPAPAEAAG